MNFLIAIHTIKGLGDLIKIPLNLFIICLKFSYICTAITFFLFLISKIEVRNKFLITISYVIDVLYRVSIIILLPSVIITVVFLILYILSFILFKLMNELYEISFENKNKEIFSTLASPIATVIGLSFTFITTLVGDKLFKDNQDFLKKIYEDVDNFLDDVSSWKLRNILSFLAIILDLAFQMIVKNSYIKKLLKVVTCAILFYIIIESVYNLEKYYKSIGKKYKDVVNKFYLTNEPIEVKRLGVITFYPNNLTFW